MTPDNPKYFKNFESAKIPNITWEEMAKEGLRFSPGVLLEVLDEARLFLLTEPGPNLERRRKLVPPWFDYWRPRLEFARIDFNKGELIKTEKLCRPDRVRGWLRFWSRHHKGKHLGVLNVAGAEGHGGHVSAAEYMTKLNIFTLWAFEQNSYFENKERKAPFLPLTVRLSMWCYSNLDLLTVSPKREAGVSEKDHYQELFDLFGATYSFATKGDPHLEEKINRGRWSEGCIIPRLPVVRTSHRVARLMELEEGRERVRDVELRDDRPRGRHTIVDIINWRLNHDIVMDWVDLDDTIFKV